MALGSLIALLAVNATGEVREYLGSPTLYVDGQPAVPLVFFGWAGGPGPEVVQLAPEWRQFHVTFVAPEDADGQAGVHFRMGGGPPGTVWVDDLRVYEGEFREDAPESLLKQSSFEGTRDEVAAAWSMFQAEYANADASWELDGTDAVDGQQALKVTIRGSGTNTMHIHFFQSGLRVRKGGTYTYSLWMKSTEARTVDFMALHIGEPWTIYHSPSTGPYASQVRLSAAAGVHIQSFSIDMPWPKPGEEPNWRGVDDPIDLTLANDPEALLLPRFGCGPPGWWLQEHPSEQMRFSDGATVSWSMASELWRAEFPEHLRALVRHCEEKYGDHMLGYHPCGQHTGEWFYERSWEPVLSDFSEPMSAGFRAWAAERYGTDEALRAAWADPGATLAGVAVPSAEEQQQTTLGLFRDPARERRVIDYFEYKQLAMEEPLEQMARVIKDETRGQKLVVFFYGYLFDMHGTPMGPQSSGHLAMERMLRCPDVDILTSPISYLDRELGGAGLFMSPVDSVRAAGKLWLNEDDTRTYLTPEDSGYGRVDTPEGSHWVHQRNFAQLLPRRLACWYMDLGGIGWLDGQDLWDNIARLREAYEDRLPTPATFAPEVAVIVDEVSPYYTKCTSALHSPLVYQMRSQMARLGAPVRIHLLSDLEAGRVPSAKAYLFLNCFRLSDGQRQAIARVTTGRAAIWFYGGGFLGDGAASATAAGELEERMSDAVGLPLRRIGSQPGTSRLAEGDGSIGTDLTLEPCWAVDEGAGTEVIARYADGSIAAAWGETGEGLRAYIGALHCPAGVLRPLLRRAGVHLYATTDDVVLADDRFLGLAATSAGVKRIRLPRQATVTDLLSGEVLGEGIDRFELTMALGETRLLGLR